MKKFLLISAAVASISASQAMASLTNAEAELLDIVQTPAFQKKLAEAVKLNVLLAPSETGFVQANQDAIDDLSAALIKGTPAGLNALLVAVVARSADADPAASVANVGAPVANIGVLDNTLPLDAVTQATVINGRLAAQPTIAADFIAIRNLLNGTNNGTFAAAPAPQNLFGELNAFISLVGVDGTNTPNGLQNADIQLALAAAVPNALNTAKVATSATAGLADGLAKLQVALDVARTRAFAKMAAQINNANALSIAVRGAANDGAGTGLINAALTNAANVTAAWPAVPAFADLQAVATHLNAVAN